MKIGIEECIFELTCKVSIKHHAGASKQPANQENYAMYEEGISRSKRVDHVAKYSKQ